MTLVGGTTPFKLPEKDKAFDKCRARLRTRRLQLQGRGVSRLRSDFQTTLRLIVCSRDVYVLLCGPTFQKKDMGFPITWKTWGLFRVCLFRGTQQSDGPFQHNVDAILTPGF